MYVCTLHIMCYIFTSSAGAMAEAFVKETIEKNSVVVFSKTYCPFCTMAKQALIDTGLQEVTNFITLWIKCGISMLVSLTFCWCFGPF